MLECLHDLQGVAPAARREPGDRPTARPSASCRSWPHEHDATAVYFASDASPFAMRRDQRVEDARSKQHGIEPRRTPGNFVADIGKPKPYAVFTPFHRAWKELPRREIHGAPRTVPVPATSRSAACRTLPGTVPDPMPGGETAGAQAHERLAARRHRHLRRAPRPRRRRHVDAEPLPALRLHLGPRARGEGRPPRRVHAPARLARLLRPRPPAQPGQRQARLSQGARRDRLGWPRRALRRLVRGPDGLSDRRRRHARAQDDGLDAQPRPPDHRVLSRQGPAHRLAPRRAALHAPAARRRRGQQQRQLAVDLVGRRRSRAGQPQALQPDAPAAAP